MVRYYIEFASLGRVGPYPTAKMAAFMTSTYESLFPDTEGKVVEVDDKSETRGPDE